MARLLDVSRAGCYQWRKDTNRALMTQRKHDRVKLSDRVLNSGGTFDGTYGLPRITADLRAKGILVTQKTVAKVMNG